MSTPTETVTAFLAECGKSKAAMQAAYRQYFSPKCVWENVGMAKTTGPDEALALMQQFESMGIAYFSVKTTAIAAQGHKVLTERVDSLLGADGKTIKTLSVMGTFEVDNGKITAWRDYFDTAGFAAG